MLALETCPPPGFSKQSLTQLKSSGFAVDDDGERNRLAIALLGCLADPDPTLRDGIVFEALSQWLRVEQLAPATIRTLATRLIAELEPREDPTGFRRPFAALILSEVVRADRLDPVLDVGERQTLVGLAAGYLRGVDDYRGFDEVEGWRHGVAHGSDLVLQLAIHPLVLKPEVKKLMEAVASQIAPAGAVFYVYGEPERLARAVFFTHRRGILEAGEWTAWLDAVAAPKPLDDWGAAFRTQAGLAKRHNTLAFLLALTFAGRSAGDEAGAALAHMAEQAIVRVYGG